MASTSETKTIYVGAINAKATLSSARSGANVVFTVSWRIWTDGNYSVSYRTLKFTYYIGGQKYVKTVVDNEARSEQTGSFTFSGPGQGAGTKGVQMDLAGDDYYNSGTATYTLHTSWDAQTFTVTFDKNGGNTPSVASKTVSYGSAYGTLATCSRTGYDFAGWYTAVSGGSKVTASTTVALTANQTLFARWTAKTFTVTFNKNGGGTPSPASKTVTYDGTYGTLASCSRSGYGLAGWYTAAIGGTKVTSSTAVKITADQPLYAHWTADTQTLTFDANGGVCEEDSRAVATEAQYGALPVPTRNGYTLSKGANNTGWYTARTGGTEVKATTTMVAGGATVYAHWTANSYTITFNANGGTTPTATKSVTYDQPFGTLPTPTRSGYAFVGWFTAAVDGTQLLATDTVKITQNRTYYAQWEPMSILHLVNGGTVTTVTNIKVVEENTVKNVIGVYSVENGVVKQGI